jgi:hypothetical protein
MPVASAAQCYKGKVSVGHWFQELCGYPNSYVKSGSSCTEPTQIISTLNHL